MASLSIVTLRILDAAANRASEGLRVVEEFVRFGLNDAHLSRLLKECRHNLATALEAILDAGRFAARDTVGDVGTTIGTTSEYNRLSPEDVARASFKRVEEALRTLEEYGKLLDDGARLARSVESLRYRLYTVEKAVLRTGLARERLRDCRLHLLVTASLCRTGLESVVRMALANGVSIVQLREKSFPDRELIAQARRLREWTREGNGLLIVNDRPDIAALAEADGVHLGQEELSVSDARRIVGPDVLIGVSTHTLDQARQAVIDGADYLGVGPTFPSRTKSFDHFSGLDFVRQVAAEISLPWFAIGGIDEGNIAAVREAGATRIAVSSAICSSEDVAAAASRLANELAARHNYTSRGGK